MRRHLRERHTGLQWQCQLCGQIYLRNSIPHKCHATPRDFVCMHPESGDKGPAAIARLNHFNKYIIDEKYCYVSLDREPARRLRQLSKNSSSSTVSSSSSTSRCSTPAVKVKSIISRVENDRQPRFHPKTSRPESTQRGRATGPRIKITPRKAREVTPKTRTNPVRQSPTSREECSSPAPLGDGPDVEILEGPLFNPPTKVREGEADYVDSLEALVANYRPSDQDSKAVSLPIEENETIFSTEVLQAIIENMAQLHSPEAEGEGVEHYTTKRNSSLQQPDSRTVVIKRDGKSREEIQKEGRQVNKEKEKEEGRQANSEKEKEEGRQENRKKPEQEERRVNREEIQKEGRQADQEKVEEEGRMENSEKEKEEGRQENKQKEGHDSRRNTAQLIRGPRS